MIEILETLKNKSSRLALKLYQGTEAEDWMLVKFYIRAAEEGEIEKLFIPENRPISQALLSLRTPNTTFYALNDKREIVYLFWARPANTHENEKTVVCSLWVEKGFKITKRCTQLTSLIYELIFSHYEYCMSTTWHEDLVETFGKGGYTVSGIIPSLYGIEPVYVLFLKKEDFYSSELYELDQKIERGLQ